MSAVGDVFAAIAARARTTVAALNDAGVHLKAGQTGLLRLTWDNGDRTVLVNPALGGVTLGWNLLHTAADELHAAVEGSALHTRVIFNRMEEHGAPIHRVINGGGIPKKNAKLNQIYANVLRKPVLVPEGDVTSLGSVIIAFLAAGDFQSIEEAQDALCPRFRIFTPEPNEAAIYDRIFPLFRDAYFALGSADAQAAKLGDILPELKKIQRDALAAR
jgi:L-ribulokinase